MPVRGTKCMVYDTKCQSGMYWHNVIIVTTLKISGLPLITYVIWPVWASDSKDEEVTLSFLVASWPFFEHFAVCFFYYSSTLGERLQSMHPVNLSVSPIS